MSCFASSSKFAAADRDNDGSGSSSPRRIAPSPKRCQQLRGGSGSSNNDPTIEVVTKGGSSSSSNVKRRVSSPVQTILESCRSPIFGRKKTASFSAGQKRQQQQQQQQIQVQQQQQYQQVHCQPRQHEVRDSAMQSKNVRKNHVTYCLRDRPAFQCCHHPIKGKQRKNMR